MRKLTPLLISKAVEQYAHTPNAKHKDIAKDLGISQKTLLKLRRDPDFWHRVYDTYMLSYEGEIVDVVRSMIREAKAGNVQAGRLVMEHSGKLEKHLHLKVSSPFEKFLEMEKHNDGSFLDSQVMDADYEDVTDKPIAPAELLMNNELPPRTGDNSIKKVEKDFNDLDKELVKKKAWLNRRKELHKWNQRAKAVGIDPLPPRRPTKGQRQMWENSIIEAEKKV